MAEEIARSAEDPYFLGQYRPVRVLTYNIKGADGGDGRNAGPDKDRLALEPIAILIEGNAPDLVALQEIAVFGSGELIVDQVAYLAERLGMYHAFGPVEGGERLLGGYVRGRDFWGNAVLSRYPIVRRVVHEFAAERGRDTRSALETRIDLGGASVSFLSVHLSYVWQTTFRQSQELAAICAALAGPVIVAGDLNASAGSAELSPLAAVLDDVFTRAGIACGDRARYSFPDGPACERDLDHIFISPEVRVLGARVCVDQTRASDHNPVCAELLVPVLASQGMEGKTPLADDRRL